MLWRKRHEIKGIFSIARDFGDLDVKKSRYICCWKEEGLFYRAAKLVVHCVVDSGGSVCGVCDYSFTRGRLFKKVFCELRVSPLTQV